MRLNYSFSFCVVLSAYFLLPLILYLPHAIAIATSTATTGGGGGGGFIIPVSDGPTVKKSERWPLVSSEFGEISAVRINDGRNGSYYLHFITMEPRSLFLPVFLKSEMVFYVNSGSGTLSWIDVEKYEDKPQQVQLQTGDIYSLTPGTVFYLQNDLRDSQHESKHQLPFFQEPQKLQIHAIFSDSTEELQHEQLDGAYVSVKDLVLGFDNKVLQETLSVPEEVIEELRRGEKQPLIVEGQPKAYSSIWEFNTRFIRTLLQTKNNDDILDFKNGKKAYNIYKAKHDVENCYGWCVTVTKKQLDVLKDSLFGVVMVNLTKGAMMGPHWNPSTAEVAIVLHGRGMIQVVCPSLEKETMCQNSKFKVEEGDVFVVPKYHPMTQISFNNDSFVFMGFTSDLRNNHPQNLAGKSLIFKMLDKWVLGKSFNVSITTIDRVLLAQRKSIIVACTSCAESMEEETTGGEEGGSAGGGGGGSTGGGEGGGGESTGAGGGGGSTGAGKEEGGSTGAGEGGSTGAAAGGGGSTEAGGGGEGGSTEAAGGGEGGSTEGGGGSTGAGGEEGGSAEGVAGGGEEAGGSATGGGGEGEAGGSATGGEKGGGGGGEGETTEGGGGGGGSTTEGGAGGGSTAGGGGGVGEALDLEQEKKEEALQEEEEQEEALEQEKKKEEALQEKEKKEEALKQEEAEKEEALKQEEKEEAPEEEKKEEALQKEEEQEEALQEEEEQEKALELEQEKKKEEALQEQEEQEEALEQEKKKEEALQKKEKKEEALKQEEEEKEEALKQEVEEEALEQKEEAMKEQQEEEEEEALQEEEEEKEKQEEALREVKKEEEEEKEKPPKAGEEKKKNLV